MRTEVLVTLLSVSVVSLLLSGCAASTANSNNGIASKNSSMSNSLSQTCREQGGSKDILHLGQDNNMFADFISSATKDIIICKIISAEDQAIVDGNPQIYKFQANNPFPAKSILFAHDYKDATKVIYDQDFLNKLKAYYNQSVQAATIERSKIDKMRAEESEKYKAAEESKQRAAQKDQQMIQDVNSIKEPERN